MHASNGCPVVSPCFGHVLQLREPAEFNISFTTVAFNETARSHPIGVIMEETIQKSCWAVTFKALAGFAGILALAYLFGTI
jgi:hypothetical protein